MKNRKRALSLLLSLVLILGLAIPAMAAEENYFAQKNLQVQQEPPTGSTPFTFAIYDSTVERKDATYSLEQGNFYVESCTAAPADKAGYQTVTLKVRGEMFLAEDPETGIELLGCSWLTGLYDYYTGVQFVMKNLQGNTSVGGSADVSYGGTTYPVTYQTENSWEQGEWAYDTEMDKAISAFDCHQTVTITAPVGYDGLVFAVMNKADAQSVEPDLDTTYYAEGENVAAYFRFGPKAVNTPDTPETPAEPAGDVQVSNWAKGQVAQATEKGLVPEGLGDDYRVSITRAQFAATAVKLYEVMSGEKIAPAAENPFTDTDNPDVLRAAAVGFVNGVTDTTFAPDALVTREQAATLLSRVYTKLGGEIPQVSNTSFADDTSVSGYAKSAVAFMADKGIVSGVGDNQFNAKGSASIEQALIIALRMLDNLK